MRVRAGTSGYSYKEWKGSFYPKDLAAAKMLAHYAARLPAVEINNTFYRMPKASVVDAWAAQAPEDFRFVIKASRRITHMARLVDCADTVRYLLDVTSGLGEKRGPILFQLPPFLKKDTSVLSDFLELLPDGVRAAFEFRNASWFDDAVYEVLRKGDAALCGGDVDDEKKSPPLVESAGWGYLRLRRSDYTPEELATWAARISDTGWKEVFAFFKHEQRGPELAETLNAAFSPGVVKIGADVGADAVGEG